MLLYFHNENPDVLHILHLMFFLFPAVHVDISDNVV